LGRIRALGIRRKPWAGLRPPGVAEALARASGVQGPETQVKRGGIVLLLLFRFKENPGPWRRKHRCLDWTRYIFECFAILWIFRGRLRARGRRSVGGADGETPTIRPPKIKGRLGPFILAFIGRRTRSRGCYGTPPRVFGRSGRVAVARRFGRKPGKPR